MTPLAPASAAPSIAALAIAALSACAPYSSYQSARQLAPGRQSIAIAGAYAEDHLEGHGFQSSFVVLEGLYRRGFTPSVEGGARITHVRASGALDDELTLAFLDVKLSLIPDELSLQIPVGAGWRQDDVHDVQVQPTLIYTATLTRAIEIDTAAKLIAVGANEDLALGKLNVALDVALRLRSDRHRFELIPEVGVMWQDLTHELGDERSLVIGAGLAIGMGF